MKLTLVLITAFSIGLANNIYSYGYGLSDAFWRVVWILDEDTVWVENFKEKKFDKITVGMSTQDVISLLGKPLNEVKECKEDCFWYYTWHARGNADFDQRWIVFNNNLVSEVRKSFFID